MKKENSLLIKITKMFLTIISLLIVVWFILPFFESFYQISLLDNLNMLIQAKGNTLSLLISILIEGLVIFIGTQAIMIILSLFLFLVVFILEKIKRRFKELYKKCLLKYLEFSLNKNKIY